MAPHAHASGASKMVVFSLLGEKAGFGPTGTSEQHCSVIALLSSHEEGLAGWSSSLCGRPRKKKKIRLTVDGWNVRALIDSAHHLERRTALFMRTLAQCNINIAARSETHLADEGELQELGAGYTFYWKGKPFTGPIHSGAIHSNMVSHLDGLPNGTSDRLCHFAYNYLTIATSLSLASMRQR